MNKLYLLNRIGRIGHRIKPHVTLVRNCADTKLRAQALKKYSSFKKISKRIRTLLILRNIFFVLAYASVVSAIVSDIIILEQVSLLLGKIAGIIGAGIFLLLGGIMNNVIILDTADAQVLASEIIAISTLCSSQKSPKKSSESKK